MNYLCYQTTLGEKHMYTERSGVKCRLYIYHWGTGLAVRGRIRDIGQNVLLSSFQTGRGSSPSYFQIFFLIFLEKTLVEI
jgi:hypothetical protein